MITTEDNTAPMITCPADLTISCEADTSAAVRGFATATDNCDPAGGIEIIRRDSIVAGACSNEKFIYRIWTATDSCGNASRCTQLITTEDNTAPMITCPADLTISCEADTSAAVRGFATATDNCDPAGGIEIIRRDSIVAGACSNEKFIYRIWTATDSCGNSSRCTQLITTEDNTAPMITCPADLTISCDGDTSAAVRGFATATDNCDPAGGIEIIRRDSIVAGACANEKFIYRIWTATDSCGNSSRCIQLITTEDNTAPMITCPADLTISCEADTSAAVRGFATATDNCDPAGGIEIIHRDSIVSGTCANEKFIYRIWTATDSCGNSSRCTQLITTEDNTAPPPPLRRPPGVSRLLRHAPPYITNNNLPCRPYDQL
ncbi:MAG: hypothetical protein IPQ10_01470 [Saprospiraceae bacterium]|nr:hypothetical protein [Saprospiraceae bacterium]